MASRLLPQTSSARLQVLRFPLIVGVVFLHNQTMAVSFSTGEVTAEDGGPATAFVRNLISDGFARVAVPAFFLISGFLFFWSYRSTVRSFLDKLSRRIRTLLIPLVFWNVVVLALIALVQSLPATRGYLSGGRDSVAAYGPWEGLDAVLGITRQPIAYQFWFIRDLFVLVLLAPLIDMVLRFTTWAAIAPVMGCWFAEYWTLRFPSVEGTLFFMLGAQFAMRNWDLFVVDRWGWPLTVAYIPVVIADAATVGQAYNPLLHKAGILLGTAAVLFLTAFAVRSARLRTIGTWLSGLSFFVFAVHEPLLTVLRKLAFKIAPPDSPFAALLFYFSIPILVIALAIGAHQLLARVTPRLTSVISGGR